VKEVAVLVCHRKASGQEKAALPYLHEAGQEEALGSRRTVNVEPVKFGDVDQKEKKHLGEENLPHLRIAAVVDVRKLETLLAHPVGVLFLAAVEAGASVLVYRARCSPRRSETNERFDERPFPECQAVQQAQGYSTRSTATAESLFAYPSLPQ